MKTQKLLWELRSTNACSESSSREGLVLSIVSWLLFSCTAGGKFRSSDSRSVALQRRQLKRSPCLAVRCSTQLSVWRLPKPEICLPWPCWAAECRSSGAALGAALAGQQPLTEKQSRHLRGIKSLLFTSLNLNKPVSSGLDFFFS